ncbi:Ig-like domain repeat protein [Granulicella rosea]|nr:Ig-like domain repeat protein [Granulicella rosea]
MASQAQAQKTIHVPADQPTIQAGINAANNGDTVLIAPGTYYENIDFKGKAITVTSSAGPASTILDGSLGNNPAVTFRTKEGPNSILNGLTIQGGGFEGYPTPSTTYNVAGIWISVGTPTISNNVITHNHCYSIESDGSSPLIVGNEIDNTLDAKGLCSFAGGAAIWLSGSLAYYNGGTAANTPYARVVGNIIQNNVQSGREDAGGNGGPGVAVWGADASIVGNTIRNNLTLGDGGAIIAFNTDEVVIIGNLIYGNQAATDGAISLRPPDESAGPFIGILASNTVYGNKQTSTEGGAFGDAPPSQVYLEGNLGQYVLVNNIVVGSAGGVAVSCGSIYNYLSYTPLVFDHNDLYNPAGAAYGGVCPDQTGTYGNISADPQFIDPSQANFQLRSGSPAIDTGNNSAPQMTATDLSGAARIQDATGKGYPQVDMGAYEYAGVLDATPTILTLTPSTYYPSSTQPLTFTVALTSAAGAPTGPVTILQDNVPLGVVMVGPSGIATYTGSGIVPGLHAYLATYPGMASFPPAVSVKFYLLVPKYTPSIKLSSAPNPSILGSPVTFTATITSLADNAVLSPLTLTDTSTNTVLATLTPNSAGVATFTSSTLTVGYHYVQVSYAGDALHDGVAASVSQQVVTGLASNTTLVSSLNPSVTGQSITFTATVSSNSGTPGGSILFSDGATALGSVNLIPGTGKGTATYTTSSLSVGSHPISATYVPANTYASSSATLNQTVLSGLATTTALACAPNPAYPDQSVAFAAAVAMAGSASGTPSGTVTISDGASLLATLTLANGAASYAALLPIGTHPITAAYVPASGYAASSATCSEVVVGHPTTTSLTVSPNPAAYGQTVTLSAATAPTGSATIATGSITFYDGAAPLATVPLDAAGHASMTTSTLSPRTHNLTAVYSGNTLLAASTSQAIAEVVTAPVLTVTIASTPNPSVAFQPVQFTAAVAVQTQGALPTLTGAVTFSSTNLSGLYEMLGTASLGANGTATFTTSSLGAGRYPVVATFTGSAVYSDESVTTAAASSPLLQTVNPAPTVLSLAATPNPGNQNAPLTLAATIADAPSTQLPGGPVVFTEPATGATLGSGTLAANGTASITLSTLSLGTHQLLASYAGTTDFLPSNSAALTVTIAPSTFTVAFTPPTLTAETAHTAPAPYAITSIGSFADTLHLSCSNLPISASCSFASVSPTLAAHEVLLGSVVLDTSGGRNCGNYDQAGAAHQDLHGSRTVFALLFPLGLVALAGCGGSKKLGRARLLTALLLLFAATNALTGCGTEIWFPTPPGTYYVQLNVQGVNTGKTQTATLTFNVTQASASQTCHF